MREALIEGSVARFQELRWFVLRGCRAWGLGLGVLGIAVYHGVDKSPLFRRPCDPQALLGTTGGSIGAL